MAEKKKEREPEKEREPAKEISLEEAFVQLDQMIIKLEARDITLDESFMIYNEGMLLLKHCNDQIDKVEKKMLVLSGDGETDEF